MPLATQVSKWVPAKLMLDEILRWISIPPRGSIIIPGPIIPQKLR